MASTQKVAICFECPVIIECRDFATRLEGDARVSEIADVWGGETESQRYARRTGRQVSLPLHVGGFCNNGHPLRSEADIKTYRGGRRTCMACLRKREARAAALKISRR